jgi:enamine deaminase RidA (YjgF/YER057c/UK114 family)
VKLIMSTKTSVTLANVTPPLVGSHVARANDHCFCAVSAPAVSGGSFIGQFVRGAASEQSALVLDIAERSLGEAGSSLARGLKIDQFVTHENAAAPYLAARAQRIATETRPSSTHVQVAGLSNPDALVGIQLITFASKTEKEAIVVPGMPASPGKPFKPAPHALVHGDFVFVTGQVAYDFDQGYPAAGEIDPSTWYQSKVLNEAKYTLGKVETIMKHLGGSLTDTVKLEIYLNDLTELPDVERVLKDAYGDALPVRSYAPTVRLAPARCRIEITAICRRPGSALKITPIAGDRAWASAWLAPAAVEFGGLIFTSSLAGNLPGHLDARLDLDAEVTQLLERALSLHPGRDGDLGSMLFAGVQVATDAAMGDLRNAIGRASGHDKVVFSITAGQRPLLWTRGSVQGDFVMVA